MIETVKRMIRDQRFCVLATEGSGAPHCSLMSFAVKTPELDLVMVTPKASRKWSNILLNPRVSLLLDDRAGAAEKDAGGTKALTLTGRAEPVEPGDLESKAKDLLVSVHPELADFLSDPGSVVFLVRPESYQLLMGPGKHTPAPCRGDACVAPTPVPAGAGPFLS